MKKYKKSDSLVLVVALLCISGASLAYNLHVSEGGDIAVSLSDIISYETEEASVISRQAEDILSARDSVAVSAFPAELPREYALLAPVVVPPQ